MIHQTAPATRKRVGTFPIPLWRSESDYRYGFMIMYSLYNLVFTFVRYGFTRSNNIPSKPARERRADEIRSLACNNLQSTPGTAGRARERSE